MQIRKVNTPTILSVGFLLIFFLAKSVEMPSLLANGLIAFMGMLNLFYCIIKGKMSTKYILIGLLFSFSMLMSILYNANASWMELLWVWCYLGVALVLVRWDISSVAISKAFFVVIAFFAIQIISGVNPQEALSGISGNNISTIVLLFVLLIYLKRDREKKIIIYWPCIVSVLLSIWGNGRAGILACGVLTILIFLYDYIVVKKLRISTLLKVGALILVGLLIVEQYFGEYIELLIYKMNRYGYKSVRTEIWREYFDRAMSSLFAFMFGVSPDSYKTPLLFYYTGNTHNAFLMLHSKYGIGCFLFVVFTVCSLICKNIWQKNRVMVIVVIVWICRSMFDWTGFPGIFDVIYFYFLISSDKPISYNSNNEIKM